MQNKSTALLLDRDGVVIYDAGYAKDASQVRLMPGIVSLITKALSQKRKIIVVTNQSGLGRGWITLEQYAAVSRRMVELLAAEKVHLDHVYLAPYFEPEHPGPEVLRSIQLRSFETPEAGQWNPHWRKPYPGMILQAQRDFNLDLANSWMVGDRLTDGVAAALAGVGKFALLKSDVFEEEIEDLPVWASRLPQLHQECRQAKLIPATSPVPPTFRPKVIELLREVSLS